MPTPKCRKNFIWWVMLVVALGPSLNGCGWVSKPKPETIMVPVTTMCPNPPPVDRLALRGTPPTVMVIDDVVYFTFTSADYAALGENMQDILFLVKQYKAREMYFKRCLVPHK